ncbi:MAG TPA: hypothetical protein VFR81_23470 [Longimicrobium sp.]|nr:hypothetical protein [Longimicrobium sp.]
MRLVIPRPLLVVAAALLSFAACTDAGTPLTLADSAGLEASFSTTETMLAPAGDLEIIARFNQTPVVTVGWAKKWIGPEGGRLEFLGFAVDVPAGAVDRVTMFSIRVPYPKDPGRVVAEFGPHGRKFTRPVIISFPLRNTSIEGAPDPTVVWWNNRWEDMGGWLSSDGSRLNTYTDHFSEYGTTTASASGGGMWTSGG